MVALFRVDYSTRRVLLAPGSADERTLELPQHLVTPTRIRFAEVHADSLIIGLPDSGEAIVEMGDADEADALRLGRPVVYLDQNHWSTLGAVFTGARPVAEDVADAARWLAARADAGEVILPLSAGRLVETSALHGDRREAVASVLLRLSRGWQMRNPPVVRREEFAAGLGSRSPRRPVFVPGMAETFASTTTGPERRVSWALALYETMLDPEAVEDPDRMGAQARQAWAEKWVPIAAALRRDCASRETVAQAARANLLLDASDDVGAVSHALGLPVKEATEALMRRGVLEAQPALGLMLQVLTARIHNAAQRPEQGDLFDFVYLPCAAAYADVLVAERRMIGYLRGARKPPARARLAANLVEAVPLVEEALSSPRDG